MANIEQQIAEVEKEISETEYNKATQQHIGRLKAKLARLKGEAEKRAAARSSGGGRAFAVKKSGHASAALIGFPSVGKSTILNHITDAKSDVAAYEFTTLDVIPAILYHRKAEIQILDLPGIISGASSGRGRGRRVLSVARNADLVMLVLDVFQPGQLKTLLHEIHEMGIRLDQKPPDVTVNRANKGGVSITTTLKLTKLTPATVKGIMEAFGVSNGSIVIRDDISDDQLIDVLSGSRKYVPSVLVLNKVDLVNEQYLDAVKKEIGDDFVPIAAEKNANMGQLVEKIWSTLDFIRIYLKRPDGEPDFVKPLILPAGSSLYDVCKRIHPRFTEGAKYAYVSGRSVKFAGQRVGLDHMPADEDVVTIMR